MGALTNNVKYDLLLYSAKALHRFTSFMKSEYPNCIYQIIEDEKLYEGAIGVFLDRTCPITKKCASVILFKFKQY